MSKRKNKNPQPNAQWRLLNPDGTFNIARKGVKIRSSSDAYHKLLSLSWSAFFGVVGAFYILVNLLFALAYYACGPDALAGIADGDAMPRILHCFFFSVQTLATIGYGRIVPISLAANILVTFEALMGLLGIAVATGLLFSRFSRPTAKVVFSNKALISEIDGVLSLNFRIANERLNQIVEAQVSVVMIITEFTKEGERYRNLYDLKLERARSPIFTLSWTIVHEIDDKSPMEGMTLKELQEHEAEFLVSLSGIDDTFAQSIYARFSYKPDEILYHHRFVDILHRNAQGLIEVELERLHDTVPI